MKLGVDADMLPEIFSNGNCYAGCPKNVAIFELSVTRSITWKCPYYLIFGNFVSIIHQWMLGDSTLVCVTLVTWSATVTMSTCPLDQIWSDYQLWFQLDSSWLIDLRCDNLMNSATVRLSHCFDLSFNISWSWDECTEQHQ